MTPKQFFDDTIGKKIDTDNYPRSNPYQCWDYFDYFCRIIGFKGSRHCSSTGYVGDLWFMRNDSGYNYSTDFYFITDPKDFKTGDWIFWKRHVAMYYNGMEVGQNQPAPYVTEKAMNWNGILGAMRWKHWQTIEIPYGYSEQTYDGQKIHLYKISGKEKIGLVSCEYGKVCNILDVWLPKRKIKAIINASYFMQSNGGYLGRVQGFLNGTEKTVDARPASSAEKGQKGDKAFMDLVLLKNGNISFGDFNSWDYPIEEVVFGVSPAGIEIADGISVNKYSPECGYGKISNPNRQTMLMRAFDGSFIIGVVSGKMAPVPTLRTWGLTVGLNHLSVYDSGGSTQMAVDGKIKVESTDKPDRKCPVWFVVYEDEEDEPITNDTIGVVHCHSSGMNIRKEIRGELIHTVKRGDHCQLIRLIDEIQSDGYQWAIVRKGNVTGYAQIDTHVMWIELYW